MKIIIISNDYPPSDRGWGYMQLCEEAVTGLHFRGHQVRVITREGGKVSPAPLPYPVDRVLKIEPDWENPNNAAQQFFIGRNKREADAIRFLQERVRQFEPDWIFVWNAFGLPSPILQEAENLCPGRVAYYLADYQLEVEDEYVQYWSNPGRGFVPKIGKFFLGPIARRILAREGRPISLRYQNVICVSAYVRKRLVDQNLIPVDSVVIHNGVNTDLFSPNEVQSVPKDFRRLDCVLAGRIVPEKGIHTVLEALSQLNNSPSLPEIRLSVIGDGLKDYKDHLEQIVRNNGLASIVRFKPKVDRSQIPQVLAQYNVLILPSEYDEPLARAMQEAMAMGLLVIGTTTGGSGELLIHENTGLVFEAGNASHLVSIFRYAAEHPEEILEFSLRGQEKITTHFNLSRMLVELETYFENRSKAL